jgi:hypothetical protein
MRICRSERGVVWRGDEHARRTESGGDIVHSAGVAVPSRASYFRPDMRLADWLD